MLVRNLFLSSAFLDDRKMTCLCEESLAHLLSVNRTEGGGGVVWVVSFSLECVGTEIELEAGEKSRQ